MVLKKILLLIALLSIFNEVLAQKDAPFWLDPYQRESKYPANQYLIGLNSELVGKNQSLANIYKQLNQTSRNQIIESIHVNIKSETVMNISIVNTESTQLLDQNSVSISKAELVGLKFENYYNKKKKTAFSFSHVRIQSIIEFNLDIIKVNTAIIDKNVGTANAFIASGNKEKAIDLLFESQVKLKEINQAAVMLMALDQGNKLDFNKIGQMKLDIAQGTDDFFNKGTLNVQQLASFYAYGLQLQLGDAGITVCKGKIGYENSGKESKFSTEFNKRVLNKLSDLKLVKIAESGCDFIFEGSFNKANDNIVVVANFDDANGTIKATVNNKFPYQSVQFGDLAFLPKNFEYINQLSQIKLVPDQESYTIKKVALFKHPIQISLQLEENRLIDIPIRFKIFRSGKLEYQTIIISDKNGIAELVLNTEQIKKSGELLLAANIDLANLLDVEEESEFIQKTLTEHPLQTRQLKVKVLAPTVFVTSKEFALGKPLGINMLAPSVKNALIELDYKFVDIAEGADYLINIESATRSGQANQYGYFSYLDATISMTRTDTGKEIYKNSLSSVKGAGANFGLASAKAYEKAKKTIGNDISYELEFGR
ncbi:MAG: hypothetical protein L3J06_07015 [Cyclobacteriaceae bacterium]|nr:hypothetical protein [Cyclobacteriaceae bacterium]